MPIIEGKEDKAMHVREDIGPLFGRNDIFTYEGSTCVLQTQFGDVYKLPEGHEDEKFPLFTGAEFSDIDEYEVFFEQ